MNIKECFDSCFYEFQIMIVSFALQEISHEGAKNKAIFLVFVSQPNAGCLLRGLAASREKMRFFCDKRKIRSFK